ncbi:M48 family metallopeptidase [Sphingomonas radiodurans]|uniref:M48 family metallopeptidase n=1 Tax=Sphingomonas radiodurans TaxID=2890321 RepID=UPI001E3551D8|nr:M48 family metallopeptidase [Sphingomonas radiodurans]WBH16148.1 M48 family metallopeptidase [Sphingomonas radiodurans]
MKLVLLAALLLAAPPAGLNVNDLNALRAIDLRLATIVHRLATANAPLCREQAPATGLVLHAVNQYDSQTAEAARATFGFAVPIGVEAVVAGSAAARAGIQTDDGVAAIGGHPLTEEATAPSSTDRDQALELLATQGEHLPLTIVRDGRRQDVTISAPRGCRARYEVMLGPEMTAQSDGRIIQIGVRFFERYRDDETAVIVAHELAHLILRHRARLEAAGVKGGLLGEIGRNARIGQLAETEADVLGVTLLHNAGYDPESAARFWQERGSDIDGGLFRSRTHPATEKRIAAIRAAVAAIPAGAGVYVPPILSARDQPMGK